MFYMQWYGACRKCIESRNLKIEGDINGSVVDYCAFNCIGSRGRKFCDTCGVDYINMIKCNYCEGTFCYTCRIKNFEREINSGEKIEGSIYRSMTNYCSYMCYITFKAESNDEIKSCIKCPTPFVEMKLLLFSYPKILRQMMLRVSLLWQLMIISNFDKTLHSLIQLM